MKRTQKKMKKKYGALCELSRVDGCCRRWAFIYVFYYFLNVYNSLFEKKLQNCVITCSFRNHYKYNI